MGSSPWGRLHRAVSTGANGVAGYMSRCMGTSCARASDRKHAQSRQSTNSHMFSHACMQSHGKPMSLPPLPCCATAYRY
eukprot:364916-Chlamydomonas_euryale.AAC.6